METEELALKTAPTALRHAVPKGWYVPLLLLAAAICLVTGQVLYGVKIEAVNRETELYSVLGGVVDLWKQGNPLLAVVLFSFSILFPTAKLLALAWIWFRPLGVELRARWAHWLEILGKWSMLDGFVVAALVGAIQLRNVVKVASASPQPAVYYFATAIMISMVVSRIMSRMSATLSTRRERHVPSDLSMLVVPWASLALLAWGLFSSILRVEKRSFESIYRLPASSADFFAEGDVFLGLLIAVFAIAVPLLYFLLLGLASWLQRKGELPASIKSAVLLLDRWAMIDVYFLGLLLVCSKVGNIANLERLPGFWMVLAAAMGSIYCALRLSRVR